MHTTISSDSIREADSRISPFIYRTPIVELKDIRQGKSSRAFLKLENLQVAGAFKARGAFNKLLVLDGMTNKVVTASTGNHGLAVATACAQLGKQAEIFIPSHTDKIKTTQIERLGAVLHVVEGDCLQAEVAARKHAGESGFPYISPYNDEDIISGQGTVGLEICDAHIENLSKLYVSVGGGGLISGVGTYLKAVMPHVKIVACQPERARSLYEMLNRGNNVSYSENETISESTAGAPEVSSITLPICKEVIDDFILLSEEEIRGAMRIVLERLGMLIEGAAALPVAAMIKDDSVDSSGNIAGIVCGRNISLEKYIQESSLTFRS
jgi:threonine dehydratase